MTSRFLDRLQTGAVLVADGATGTNLQQAGLKPGAAPYAASLKEFTAGACVPSSTWIRVSSMVAFKCAENRRPREARC